VVVVVDHVNDFSVSHQNTSALRLVVRGAPPSRLVSELVVNNEFVFVQEQFGVLVTANDVDHS
jgi:hypothetical protein